MRHVVLHPSIFLEELRFMINYDRLPTWPSIARILEATMAKVFELTDFRAVNRGKLKKVEKVEKVLVQNAIVVVNAAA